ncbi:MAG TPA: hypothetical protein DDX98_10200 [Bacteroidales bacterium]|jgi:hypothetical protein|nr:hypothetical protein [Bacteroidales bacterium]
MGNTNQIKSLKDTIKSIDISHLFAKNLKHGVSHHDSNWELFEPARFIYSFFAFNMLYEIDWKESLKRRKVWHSRSKKYGHASNKMVLLLKFIYSKRGEKSFKEYYSKYDGSLRLLDNSYQIVPDYNINRPDLNDFLVKEDSYVNNYRRSLKNLKDDKFSIQDHYKLLIFCYQIRNNVFHGLKKASEMIKSGQRERLVDYSNILIATKEMFFDIMEEEIGYLPANDDNLKENAGIISYL